MSTNQPEALRLAEWLDRGNHRDGDAAIAAELRRLHAEANRLLTVIYSRPAINSGLPATYIEWSQSIYEMDMSHAFGVHQ